MSGFITVLVGLICLVLWGTLLVLLAESLKRFYYFICEIMDEKEEDDEGLQQE